jgi:hypothetical protein
MLPDRLPATDRARYGVRLRGRWLAEHSSRPRIRSMGFSFGSGRH